MGWPGTLGVNWQHAKCLDEHGKALTQVLQVIHPGVAYRGALLGSCL